MVARCPKGKTRFPAKTGKCYNKDGSDIPDGEKMEAEIKRLKAEIRRLRGFGDERDEEDNPRRLDFERVEELTETRGGFEFYKYIFGQGILGAAQFYNWIFDRVSMTVDGNSHRQHSQCETVIPHIETFLDKIHKLKRQPLDDNQDLSTVEMTLAYLTKKDLKTMKKTVEGVNKTLAKKDEQLIGLHKMFYVLLTITSPSNEKECWSGAMIIPGRMPFLEKAEGFIPYKPYIERTEGALNSKITSKEIEIFDNRYTNKNIYL